MSDARVHVAVAVIENDNSEILVSLRPDHVHQGGLWEFPGGKINPDETVEQGLRREIEEEVGLRLLSVLPLIRIPHDYGDKRVLLDVWRADSFHGEAHGRESQHVRWVNKNKLNELRFPAANRPIINAACLPDLYMITPSVGDDIEKFMQCFEQSLIAGIRLVQLRDKHLHENQFRELALRCREVSERFNAKLILNSHFELVDDVYACGAHLTSRQLHELKTRPVANEKWLAASCHNAIDLAQAVKLDVDFAVLGPVKPTVSHPGMSAIGWDYFTTWVDQINFPVYALGGLTQSDVSIARYSGAQGIAAISDLWAGGR